MVTPAADERPSEAQIKDAVARTERYLCAEWEARAERKWQRYAWRDPYVVDLFPGFDALIRPVPDRPGWWIVGSVLRTGSFAESCEVWLEPTSMRVKVCRQRFTT